MKIAAIQMQMQPERTKNINQAKQLVRQAAQDGAKVIVLPELFSEQYFCQEMNNEHFKKALPRHNHPMIESFSALAKELGVVLPLSYFERDQERFYNALVLINADGNILGNYRKTHIPDGPGYEERFYFSEGDTGFMVHDTAFGKLGVGICWDQWFSESARAMALLGAEILIFPSAIGSEPEIGGDSSGHWQRVQQGHAAANVMPLVAVNRIGTEHFGSSELTFYGRSFICDETGEKVVEASRERTQIISASFDLAAIAKHRQYWGLFKDRRPNNYHVLCSHS